MESTVTQVIEQQLTGIDKLLYFSSNSSANGQSTITLTFATGTNPDIAQVQVQNKVTLATPLLPAAVTQQGVIVAKASPDILMFLALQSSNASIDAGRLSDILASQVQPAIGRVSGVGNTNLLGAEYAARIWLDPDKLHGYGLSTTQVLNAVTAQNAQFAAGSLGADPAINGQEFTATVAGDQLFSTLQQFRDIILLANSDGTVVKLSDVARIAFGPQTSGFAPVYDGKPAAGLGVFLLPGANALQVGNAVKAQMAALVKDMPPGVTWDVPYDTTPFITASITDVVKTLLEAIVLVFFVMLIFLQNLRATIIPTLVIPVALLGTFVGLTLLHFTLNQLTLFGMVLAIGIVVDDAIVVIENVERIMTEEHLEPKEATRKAMGQITGAIIAITVVLSAVFIPSALQPGATGIIYSQFALTIAVSMGISALLAMSFTPSLCAAILKPVHEQKKNRFFRWFDRTFDKTSHTYVGHVGSAVRHAPRWMAAFAVVVVLAGFLYTRLPTSFVPDEDQGAILALVNLPPGATLQRTNRVMTEIRDRLLRSPIGDSIAHIFQPEGFSFIGTSENVGIVFIKLKTWSARSQTAMQLIPRINRLLSDLPDAQVFAIDPPTIRGLSQFGGIDMYLQARTGQSPRAVVRSRPDAARRRGKGSHALRYPAEFAAERAAVGAQGGPEPGADDGALPDRRVQHRPDGVGAALHQSVHLCRPGQEGLRPGGRVLPDGNRRARSSVHTQRHIQRGERRRQHVGRCHPSQRLSDADRSVRRQYGDQPVQHGSSVERREDQLGSRPARPAALQRLLLDRDRRQFRGRLFDRPGDAGAAEHHQSETAAGLRCRLDRTVVSGASFRKFVDGADGAVDRRCVPVPRCAV